ncbi:DNA (cytosine-5)-methyltransferase 3C-like [Syngnathoides biaculeatus]|uniref:DNA (cytosine-5)-methyltransferase 3C-like n=1 Tax=Syngnathoides biaculeatus TaxID=300417 RepID=UPI002ADE1D0B|nr:DNA (cytosine-5)-methyltransferase 3C-like [Syngnathoides biaculeatus]
MSKRLIVSPDPFPHETDWLDLLTWLNTLLKTKFCRLQHVCSGACHCQIMDCVIPGSIDMTKVKFDAKAEHDCKHNYGLLQEAFTKNHITRKIPSDELIKGDFKINFEFLLWFKAFYAANATEEEYDAVNARDNREISLYLPSSCSAKSGAKQDQPTKVGTPKKSGPLALSKDLEIGDQGGESEGLTESGDSRKTAQGINEIRDGPLGENGNPCKKPLENGDKESLRDSEGVTESNDEPMSDGADDKKAARERNERYMSAIKPCHVLLTKLKDLNINNKHDDARGESDDSGEKERAPSRRHKAFRTQRKAAYQDGKGFLAGELVWGKIEGCPWWPGLVIPWKKTFAPKALRRIEWFGDGTYSKIKTDALRPFRDFTANFCKSSFSSLPSYQEAIFHVIELASERCDKSFEEAKGDKEKELNLMLDWALKGFLPTGPEGFAPLAHQDSAKLDSDSAHSDWQPPVKKKFASKSRASTSSYVFTRDVLIRRLKDKGTKLKDCCLCCGSPEIEAQHPLFEGGLCFRCKENFTETLYRYDEDGYQSYCTVCCGGSEVILCGNSGCCRCFCKECLEILVERGTFNKLKEVDPWSCFVCQPAQCQKNLKLRPDWSVRVQVFFANNSAMDFDPHRVYPSIAADKRRPLKVLSLFDGIATGYLVLKDLGFKLERYIASEICEDSIAVGMVKHKGKIEYVNDVRTITRKHLAEWGPFDLLIGGSPCNDLSIVNPLRKGLFEGTGRLFFEFYRILTLLKPKEGDDRPFFWLFENVVFMSTRDKTDICRFLECNPVLIDAVSVSPAHRARYFWGNLPGMSRPLSTSLDQKLSLQDCLEAGRVAKLDKVRTITTKSNSLRQGKLGLPVVMNGKEDFLWLTEMEQIFGFPKHYTDVNNMGRVQRQRVLGRSWSVPVVRHLLAPLKDYFECEEQQ